MMNNLRKIGKYKKYLFIKKIEIFFDYVNKFLAYFRTKVIFMIY